jgi:hypothetical protein
MNESKDAGHVQCEICLKNLPASEAHLEEAGDYVIHFCGLECFEKWREKTEQQHEAGKQPGSVRTDER